MAARFQYALTLLYVCSCLQQSVAAEPTLIGVDVRGIQIGGMTTISITGSDLTAAPKLILPFPITQTLQSKSTDKTATFAVTVPETATPGWYQLRVATANGVSLPVVIGVDRLPQIPFAAKVERLPAALHGSVTGSAVLETKFEGKAKQKIIVEVEAQRLGSKLRPILHLTGPIRKQLAWAWGTPSLGGDCWLETTLPVDGTYAIAIHDAEYAAGAPGHFRLKIGDFAACHQTFPPVIGANPKTAELLGPMGTSTVTLPNKRDGTVVRLDWPNGGTWTGPQPFATVSTRMEIIEAIPPSATPQELPVGILGVSGKLSQPNEEDRYRLPTTPGAKLKFDLFAERLGSPLDVSLVIRNEVGVELARADDGTGSLDPTLEFTVPEKATSVVVAVVDAQGRGGPRGVYRLTIDPAKPEALANVKLFTPTGRVSIPVNGIVVVPVIAERTNYSGLIKISATGLPKGVTLENTMIPEGADGTLVAMKTTDVGDAAISSWIGSADIGSRPVTVRGHPLERIQPWLAQEFAVAVVPASLKVKIDWRDLPATTALVPTRKLVLPLKMTRPDPNTVVRLTLLTSQFVPLASNQPDATKAIRAEKAVEIPANAADGEMSLLVPGDLPSQSYDVAIQAEVLSADKKTVLANAFTPVRRLPVFLPVALKLKSAEVVAKLDPKLGYIADIAGTVERLEGIAGDVTLTVSGMPTGARLDPATAKVPAATVAAKLIFPATTVPGTLGIKLIATIAPDPKLPAVVVKSREVEVTVTIPAK